MIYLMAFFTFLIGALIGKWEGQKYSLVIEYDRFVCFKRLRAGTRHPLWLVLVERIFCPFLATLMFLMLFLLVLTIFAVFGNPLMLDEFQITLVAAVFGIGYAIFSSLAVYRKWKGVF